MNVRAILEKLERLGVELRVAGDDLEYEGPEEAITPELLEQLKAHKVDLMVACGKAETVAEEDRQPAEVVRMRTVADPEARKLQAACWEPKERCGKIIWKRPDNGFYVSQEVAIHFMDTGIVNIGHKSGAIERR
jgi:hypothetical protein